MPKKLLQEEFIERCKKKHNGYYSYDKTVYTGMSNDDYIIVTCPIHGDFKQLAAGHIRGKSCKDCAGTNSNCKVFLTSSLYLIINLNKGNYGFTSNI